MFILTLCILAAIAILIVEELVDDKRTCKKDGTDYVIRISEQYIDHAADTKTIGSYVLKVINDMED